MWPQSGETGPWYPGRGTLERLAEGEKVESLPPRQLEAKVIPPRQKTIPPRVKSLGGMTIDDYTLGGKGWREYRKTGGKVYYARDRWYEREGGEWVKRSQNRPDISSLTGEQYEQWKSRRAAARERRKQQRTRSRDIRQVVIE